MPELKDYIVKYQDPHQADSIMKIRKELDDTKIILHKTIESVLERGEKIDDLVAKSDGLSAQSKMFYSKLPVLGKRGVVLTVNSPSEEAELVLRCHVEIKLSGLRLRLIFLSGITTLRLKIYIGDSN
jgi:hypothetical protein